MPLKKREPPFLEGADPLQVTVINAEGQATPTPVTVATFASIQNQAVAATGDMRSAAVVARELELAGLAG